jgi:phage gp16-like protein
MSRSAKQDAQRKGHLATIHIARQLLALDEDTYRALLRRVSAEHGPERDSARDLSIDQRKAVIRELQRLGAKAPGPRKQGAYPGRPSNMHRLSGEVVKIEAQLADMRLSWAYADAIAKRMFGIPKVAWCRKRDQLVAILSALHVEQRKRGMGEEIDGYLRELGLTDAEVRARWPGLSPTWRRNAHQLKFICKELGLRVVAKRTEQEPGHADD